MIHHRFDTVARGARDRVALRTASREATYGELREGARRVAGRLDELAPGSRVAILSRDHVVVVSAILGALEAGCAFAPLDLATAGKRLPALLAALACDAIVVDAATRPLVPPLARAPAILELERAGAAPAPPSRTAVSPGRGRDPDAMCSIYFTSGSTGTPRAIAGRACGIDHHIAWEIERLGLDRSVRGAVLHAMSYDAYLPDVLVPLCAGGIACAPDPRDAADPARLCAWLERAEITLLHCVPSLFRDLLACPEAERLGSLRHVLLAGEVVRPADVRAARRVLGDGVRLFNLYGPTEATLVKLHHEITGEDLERPAIPIGVPMPGVTVHLLDDRGRPCAPGETGQIAIQSRYGSLGYLGEPELTRARFLAAPDGSGEQVYLTGDYGSRLPDGTLLFHGRRDRQIKLLGARVDLDEVEAILGACDGVVDAAVVVAGDLVLYGFVTLAAGATLARVREQALQRLAPASRLARLTPLAAFPRTPSGKLDRRRLALEAEAEAEAAAAAAAEAP